MELQEINKKIEVLKKNLENKNIPENLRKELPNKIKELEKLRSEIESKDKEVKKEEKVIAASKEKKHTVKHIKAKKEVSDAKKTAADILSKYSKVIKNFNGGRSTRDIIKDKEKAALPVGKRISSSGKPYDESRPNRSDINQKAKLEKGGEVKTYMVSYKVNPKQNFASGFEKVVASSKEEAIEKAKEKYYKEWYEGYEKGKKYAKDWIFYIDGEYAHGGKIENQYYNFNTIDEVWNAWDIDQKTHFLKDHEFLDPKNKDYVHLLELPDNYNELPISVKRALQLHCNQGEYAKGGETHSEDSFEKGDKVKKRTTGEKAEVLRRNHNGSKHHESYVVKKEDGKEGYWWASDMEICYECGGRAYEHGGELDNKELVANKATEIAHHAKELHETLESKGDIPAWVVAKIERSATDISDVAHYLEGEGKEFGMGSDMEDDRIKLGDAVEIIRTGQIGKVIRLEASFAEVILSNNSQNDYYLSDIKKTDKQLPKHLIKAKPTKFLSQIKYAKGGKTFASKTKAVASSLSGKDVPAKYQKTYGKKYSLKEAKEAANRIIGKQVSGEKKMGKGGVANKPNLNFNQFFEKFKMKANIINAKPVKNNYGELVFNVSTDTKEAMQDIKEYLKEKKVPYRFSGMSEKRITVVYKNK